MSDLRVEYRRVLEEECGSGSDVGVAALLDVTHKWVVGRIEEYRAEGHAHAYILGIVQGELEGMVILSAQDGGGS